MFHLVGVESHALIVHLREEFGSILSAAWETHSPPGLFPKVLVQNLESLEKTPVDFIELWSKPPLQNWDWTFLFGCREGLRSPAVLAWVSTEGRVLLLTFRGIWI